MPLAEKAEGLATYRELRDKGYLAYVVEAEVAGTAKTSSGFFNPAVAVKLEMTEAAVPRQHYRNILSLIDYLRTRPVPA